MTGIPYELITAYKATEFTVLEPRAFTLRIEQHCPELQVLYIKLGVSSAGYLTAWNPFSEETSDDDNRKAQRKLLRKLSLHGFPTLNAMGVDPSGDWPSEESVFVPGLSLNQTKLLGTEFGQNAVVWAGLDAVPQLILLR